jgi:hypothetical protein
MMPIYLPKHVADFYDKEIVVFLCEYALLLYTATALGQEIMSDTALHQPFVVCLQNGNGKKM